MSLKDRIARAYGLDPSQVWYKSGPDGRGWYIRPFGALEKFIGSNGAYAVLSRRAWMAGNEAAAHPRNKRMQARAERLAARLRALDEAAIARQHLEAERLLRRLR